MAKFLIIMCAFFAVSMARRLDRDVAGMSDVQRVRQMMVDDPKLPCVLSINQAINDLSLSRLRPKTPELRESLLRVWRPAYTKLEQFITNAVAVNAIAVDTVDVTSQLKTSSGTIIQCNEKIAKQVIKITNDALDAYETILCEDPLCWLLKVLLPTTTPRSAD